MDKPSLGLGHGSTVKALATEFGSPRHMEILGRHDGPPVILALKGGVSVEPEKCGLISTVSEGQRVWR